MMEARPNFNRGDRVCVREPGVGSWLGTVNGIKPGATGWRIEVCRDDSGITWSLPAGMVRHEGVSRNE